MVTAGGGAASPPRQGPHPRLVWGLPAQLRRDSDRRVLSPPLPSTCHQGSEALSKAGTSGRYAVLVSRRGRQVLRSFTSESEAHAGGRNAKSVRDRLP